MRELFLQEQLRKTRWELLYKEAYLDKMSTYERGKYNSYPSHIEDIKEEEKTWTQKFITKKSKV